MIGKIPVTWSLGTSPPPPPSDETIFVELYCPQINWYLEYVPDTRHSQIRLTSFYHYSFLLTMIRTIEPDWLLFSSLQSTHNQDAFICELNPLRPFEMRQE